MIEPIHILSYENTTSKTNSPETISHNGIVLALIIWHDFNKLGVHFVTPDELSQQVAYMHHPAGKQIQPHVHNSVTRLIDRSQEVLVIKKGKLRVDFYTQAQQYLISRILTAGDVIVLIDGGHGFSVLEEVEMIEVKQGPFMGDQERTRFTRSSELFVISE